MKTNQVMRIGNFAECRTQDNFFNANITLKEWNLLNPQKHRTMPEYWQIKATKELVEHLKKNEGIERPHISSNKGTWMHPLLFIDFAMWISVEFKVEALKLVLSNLIQFRHDAGDYYKEMTAVIMEKYIEFKGCKPPATLYINEANMIREMSGTLGKERNELTDKELAKITTLQKVNANLISKNVGKESRKKHLLIIAESI